MIARAVYQKDMRRPELAPQLRCKFQPSRATACNDYPVHIDVPHGSLLGISLYYMEAGARQGR